MNELDGLHSRTGMEAQMFAARNSTDMPIKNVAFLTASIDGFMQNMMKLDYMEYLGKLEGYAIQGLKGTYSPRSMDSC